MNQCGPVSTKIDLISQTIGTGDEHLCREDDLTQPENRGAVVCRALTNRTETPFLAQLLSLKYSGPLETSLQAFLIVG